MPQALDSHVGEQHAPGTSITAAAETKGRRSGSSLAHVRASALQALPGNGAGAALQPLAAGAATALLDADGDEDESASTELEDGSSQVGIRFCLQFSQAHLASALAPASGMQHGLPRNKWMPGSMKGCIS